jgi:hypothetical protein
MPLPFAFDFRNPDYYKIFEWRLERMDRLRKNPQDLAPLKKFYRDNIAQFIIDWGTTVDPRNVDLNLPAVMPFLLFPKQEEIVNWVIDNWKNRRWMLIDKSREMGLTWLLVAVISSICILYDDVTCGFGSHKESYVDQLGNPGCIFEKARHYIQFIPREFRGAWDLKKDAPHRKIFIPHTKSVIIGESGPNMGRGNRYTIFVGDEAAWYEKAESIDAALSQATRCLIYVSTPHGPNNTFARKRFSGAIPVMSMHWRDDPRKDDAWYQEECKRIDDPVIIAQELDLNYTASIEGVLIPASWVQAAIDAHVKLGIAPSGLRKVGFDVADEGRDANAIIGRYGILVEHVEAWSGKDSDILRSTERVASICDVYNYPLVIFDSDGMGAGVRGDARSINGKRPKDDQIEFVPFRGSGEVFEPDAEVFPPAKPTKGISTQKVEYSKGRTNADFFANAKAQAWWLLRKRFQNTYRAVVEKQEYDKDQIISISSANPGYRRLVTELSQPTYKQNDVGKILIDKMPDGSRSPNYADACMIAFAPEHRIRKGFFNVG